MIYIEPDVTNERRASDSLTSAGIPDKVDRV
jgi:hypothetical protein